MKLCKTRFFCDIAFILALVFKIASYGLYYFPVLDDYIQYGGYPLYENISHVYLNIGTIATRPFASLADPVIWGLFYPDMFFAALLISFLFFFGAKLLANAFEQLGIYVTPFLYAILLLCPLGFEGTYWISAASRICVGLFFTGLSLFLLIKLIDKKTKFLLIPYALATLLSFGFYESVMIISALLQFVTIISLVKNKRSRIIYLITPALCGILMLLYYKFAGSIGALGSRANGFSFDSLGTKSIEFFTQFFEVLVYGGVNTIFKGACLGAKLMLTSYVGLLKLLLLILISGLCAYFGAKKEFSTRTFLCVALGLALIFLPLVPNLLTSTVWLTYRSIVPCFIGLVLVSAPLFEKLFINKKVRASVLFIIVMIFMLANVNELDTYRRVSETDNKLVSQICEQLDDDVLSGKKETIVLLKEAVIITQVSYHKDHVKSVFDSDWALTGAVRAKCKNVKIKMLTPVYSLDGIDASDKQIIYIGGDYE